MGKGAVLGILEKGTSQKLPGATHGGWFAQGLAGVLSCDLAWLQWEMVSQ